MVTDSSRKAPICPVCESVSDKLLSTINLEEQFGLYCDGDREVQTKLLEVSGLEFENYNVYCCEHCQLQFSYPPRAPAGEWYAYAYNRLGLHASDRWEFDYVVNTIKDGDLVGEIGCGTGIFLGKCREIGIDAYGIDFSESSVRKCREKGLNANLVGIHLSDPDISIKKSVIVSFHVLEHLEDPSSLFDMANKWATNNASFWIAVPSNRRINRYRRIKDIFDDPPHHLTRWTRDSLKAVGEKNGWKMVDIIYEDIGFKQKLWSMCVTSKAYELAKKYVNTSTRWKDRLLRYSLYPFMIALNGRGVIKLSGHSMMAKYIRY